MIEGTRFRSQLEKVMKSGPKAYSPTAMERAAKQEQRHEKKKMRAQAWKSWVEDANEDFDDDENLEEDREKT